MVSSAPSHPSLGSLHRGHGPLLVPSCVCVSAAVPEVQPVCAGPKKGLRNGNQESMGSGLDLQLFPKPARECLIPDDLGCQISRGMKALESLFAPGQGYFPISILVGISFLV